MNTDKIDDDIHDVMKTWVVENVGSRHQTTYFHIMWFVYVLDKLDLNK